MIVVRDLQSTYEICNTAIRNLVQQRIHDLGGEAFDTNALGYFVVLDSGDSIQAIDRQAGFNILYNRVAGVRFDQADFTPSFEFIEEFSHCFDMVFILGDDGLGVELFVPKDDSMDPDLIAMFRMFAFQSEDAP